ncbi:MAG: hypothetical protein WBK09_05835 [Limnohabitans sp.]|uniref:hypothetical protein n=1 Tax=Limnohabitans sp. TaxID=1907725 RepID=UPI003BAF94AC
MAIGLQLAKDLAGALADHAVEQHSLRIGLHHVHFGTGTDVKTLPVDGRTLAGLGDVELIRALGQAGRALHHSAAGGQCIGSRLRPSQAHKHLRQHQGPNEHTRRGQHRSAKSRAAKS